ncbi:MAG TPA: glycosyltransferase [Polyangiaceae bacterium]|nr:glycosyltransferase [Polyangiaceae bacterium]
MGASYTIPSTDRELPRMGIVQKTLVVVPCYDEAKRLDPTAFLAVLEREPMLGFVMVNDGSTDDTKTILEALRERAPGRVEVVHLEKNSGKAEAVRRGVLRAFELGAEISGYWDADLATPLECISRFAERLEKSDLVMVVGSRVRLLGHHVERNAFRHYLGRGFGTLASLALGVPIYDTQCGAKLFKTTPAIRSAFESPFTLVWSFDVEFFSRLLAREADVGDIVFERHCAEFPLEAWRDAPGSKLTMRHFPSIALELARLYLTARAVRRPNRR